MSANTPPPPPPFPPQQPTAKMASADAKAAKARSKALRPWYRKKRYWLLAIVVIAIAATAAGANKSKDDKAGSGATAITISKGLGSQDASADVTNPVLGPPDALGFRSVTLTVTNNSSKRSNYLIEVSIEAPDGKTQYDTSIIPVNNLEPGQTTTTDGFPVTKEVPADAVIAIKEVTRLAS